jgi:hypothetical protein
VSGLRFLIDMRNIVPVCNPLVALPRVDVGLLHISRMRFRTFISNSPNLTYLILSGSNDVPVSRGDPGTVVVHAPSLRFLAFNSSHHPDFYTCECFISSLDMPNLEYLFLSRDGHALQSGAGRLGNKDMVKQILRLK